MERTAAAAPLTSEEARQQARAEGLTLRLAENKTGFFGVYLIYPGRPKPYQARVKRGGKQVRPGLLRHRRGGGTVRRAIAGGAGGGGKGCDGGEPGHAPCPVPSGAVLKEKDTAHGSAYATRRHPQGGGRGPAHAVRRIRQGRGRRQGGRGL